MITAATVYQHGPKPFTCINQLNAHNRHSTRHMLYSCFFQERKLWQRGSFNHPRSHSQKMVTMVTRQPGDKPVLLTRWYNCLQPPGAFLGFCLLPGVWNCRIRDASGSGLCGAVQLCALEEEDRTPALILGAGGAQREGLACRGTCFHISIWV